MNDEPVGVGQRSIYVALAVSQGVSPNNVPGAVRRVERKIVQPENTDGCEARTHENDPGMISERVQHVIKPSMNSLRSRLSPHRAADRTPRRESVLATANCARGSIR